MQLSSTIFVPNGGKGLKIERRNALAIFFGAPTQKPLVQRNFELWVIEEEMRQP
jgi:hypothetical protein